MALHRISWVWRMNVLTRIWWLRSSPTRHAVMHILAGMSAVVSLVAIRGHEFYESSSVQRLIKYPWQYDEIHGDYSLSGVDVASRFRLRIFGGPKAGIWFPDWDGPCATPCAT